MKDTEQIFLSAIICIYNMPREATRTILSALPPYQKNVDGTEYELIIVDNGSSQPVDAHFLNGLPPTARYLTYPGKSASPVMALNWAAKNIAKGDLILFCIDGARILSDGLVAACLKYAAFHEQAFVYTLGWHLGPDLHMRSAETGYSQEVEDKLLENIDWYNHPERLFEISTLAGSSKHGFFSAIRESNAFVTSRGLLDRIGYYNEKFSSPGGGLANLELFSRYVTAAGVTPICLLGEGTFHQFHDGIATSGKVDRVRIDEEYVNATGNPYRAPHYSTMFAGTIRKGAHKFYVESAQKINYSLL